MTGATDLAIITATLQLHDIDPTHDLVTEFARRARDAFDACRADIAPAAIPWPVPAPRSMPLPNALADNDTVLQSVLTGNAAPIARCRDCPEDRVGGVVIRKAGADALAGKDRT
ncbi:hypothetical protein [Actinomadura madurae]|uniref:hypothetical protein n=1 Tax=Actinomadura madurae TaxID=1993 RepID=UPI0020D1FA63|nr:hypothetical protein [Actinomadura madurae]MCQ0010307.1 hypothetical protein [Actinomadura madurae]